MLIKTPNIVVGLTTFHNEMLQISVPMLGRINQKFLLVIHNDNPDTTITTQHIRKLGFHGKVIILNSPENMGLMRSRMAIINAVQKLKKQPEWIVFNDDDDLLTNLDIPENTENLFAVIQNMLIIRHRLYDLLRAMACPDDCVPDGNNIILNKPHIGFAGTLIKCKFLYGLNDVLAEIMDKIQKLDNDLDYCPPTDAIMWEYLKIYAQFVNKYAAPVYMDKINYIATNIDTAQIKYGRAIYPTKNPNAQYSHAISRYVALIKNALRNK